MSNDHRSTLRQYLGRLVGEGRRWDLPIDMYNAFGISKSGMWRFLHRQAWAKEDKFFDPIAVALRDTKSKLLWMAGYNPFAEHNLTVDELFHLWEVVKRIADAVRGGHFHGADVDFNPVALSKLAHCSHIRSGRLVEGCEHCKKVPEDD